MIKECFIPKKVESLNKFIFGAGSRIIVSSRTKRFTINRAYTKYRNSWYNNIFALIQTPDQKCQSKAIVEITFYKKGQKYDFENFVGGCKPILDALTKLGWIVDDNDKWIEVKYAQLSAKQEKKEVGVNLKIIWT